MAKPKPMICLDTQILIWGVKEDASPGQEAMIDKAKLFVRSATENGDSLLVPSVVVGELLMRIPPDLHVMTINLIRRGFITAVYDLEAAANFARLWQERTDDGVIEELRKAGATRSEMKADCQIVATALAANATSIVSHDQGLKKFAGSEIKVIELPGGVEQLGLLEDAAAPPKGVGGSESVPQDPVPSTDHKPSVAQDASRPKGDPRRSDEKMSEGTRVGLAAEAKSTNDA